MYKFGFPFILGLTSWTLQPPGGSGWNTADVNFDSSTRSHQVLFPSLDFSQYNHVNWTLNKSLNNGLLGNMFKYIAREYNDNWNMCCPYIYTDFLNVDVEKERKV